MFLWKGSTSWRFRKAHLLGTLRLMRWKLFLDELAGLSQLNFEADEAGERICRTSEFPRPSRVHVSAAKRRRQSKRVILQDGQLRAQREIEGIFPYVLGAVTPEILAQTP